MKIVVLAGGISTERNVSFSSGAKICTALRSRGHAAVLIDLYLGLQDYPGSPADIFSAPPALPGTAIGSVAPDLAAVKKSRRDRSPSVFGPGVLDACKLADVVFLGLHGTCGEDGRVQATFDLMGIPYTGSGYLGSAIAMD
ncbi:MAG: D-alanine--D-alanine ligase, partial [Oscillospiraceae bacterium]